MVKKKVKYYQVWSKTESEGSLESSFPEAWGFENGLIQLMRNFLMGSLSLSQSRGLNQILWITPANILHGKPEHNLFINHIMSFNAFLGIGFFVLLLFGWREPNVFLVKFWGVEWRGGLLGVVFFGLEVKTLAASEPEVLHWLNGSVDKIKISNRCNRFMYN